MLQPRRSNWRRLRERRDAAAQTPLRRWQAWPHSKSAIDQRRLCCSVLSPWSQKWGSGLQSLRHRSNRLLPRSCSARHENQELADQLVDLDAERNASEARDGLLQFESEQVRARLAEIEEALHQARQLLDQARDRRGELSAAAAKLQSDAQYMAETCLNELGIERHELMADTTIAIVSGEATCQSKTRSIARCALGSTPWVR